MREASEVSEQLREALEVWLERRDALEAAEKEFRRAENARIQAHGLLQNAEGDVARRAGVGRNIPERHVRVNGRVVRLAHVDSGHPSTAKVRITLIEVEDA